MSETRYLISIGINDYEFAPLDYCAKDSQDICNIMELHCNIEHGNSFNISSEYNKPNHKIFESFETIFERIKSKFVQGNDSIFFYFSGHGVKSGNSTSMAFHNRVVELQELFALFCAINPKFIFCLIDSCYSGVGIDDGIVKTANELLFAQQLKLANGYNIICACANDAPAKEDSDIKNGRLTKIFMDIVKNELNYVDGILNLSKVFQLVDDSFKNNPEFRQFPFAQTRGLGTYPIALVNDENNNSFYSTHYIDDIEAYNWTEFKNELSQYCLLNKGIINEFTRLVREILRNSITWSGASFLKVEISKGAVSLIDNSGNYFDIFNPTPGTKIRGGGTTAKIFKEAYYKEYNFSFEIKPEETIQIFSFLRQNEIEDVCVWKIDSIRQLMFFQKGKTIEIPDSCENYKIYIPQGGIDLSSIYEFLKNAITCSQKTGKSIQIIIDGSDKLKSEFIKAFQYYHESGQHNVTII